MKAEYKIVLHVSGKDDYDDDAKAEEIAEQIAEDLREAFDSRPPVGIGTATLTIRKLSVTVTLDGGQATVMEEA